MHYSYKAYGEGDAFILSGEPSDLFFGLSLDYKSQWELNLVYNRATEDYSSDPNTVTFDKDGIGLEVGKIIPIPLVHKSHFDLSVEFVGGGYGMIYPYKKVGSGLNSVNLETANAMDDLFYHLGFYWGIRLKYLISQKVGLYIGYKSIIPVRSNEFEITRGKEILITKSFLTIGVSF
ncbi:MAG: hypothetical protein GY757_25630 [bacterium]|nr:hypothetical protein [bacterium]